MPTCASWSGVGKGYLEKPAVVREGNGKPLPWPSGPHVACSGLQIKDKQTKCSPLRRGLITRPRLRPLS